ncbi:MAG: hypothetical protein SVY10_04175 [Thermodesulfobacteriota bacterium]|nr:hypothetical protein [Thermodesulfobacteriota bacterium]
MTIIAENPVKNLTVSRNQALNDPKSSKSLNKTFQQSSTSKQVVETDNSQVNYQDKVDSQEDNVKIQNLHRWSMEDGSDQSAANVEQAQKWVEEVKGMIKSENEISRINNIHTLNHENVVRFLI